MRFVFGDGLLTAEIVGEAEEGKPPGQVLLPGNIYNVLDQIGQMPLPHYITHELEDKERYQTVYSKDVGSAAAPLPGSTLPRNCWTSFGKRGEDRVRHPPCGPWHLSAGKEKKKTEEITDHKMHSEHYWMPADTAAMINETKAAGGRVICVGTTSCRTVESVATNWAASRSVRTTPASSSTPDTSLRCWMG